MALMPHSMLLAMCVHLNIDAQLQLHAAVFSSAIKQIVFQPREAAERFHLEDDCVKTIHP